MGSAAIGLAIYIYYYEQSIPPGRIKLTAGSAQSMRHQFALALEAEARSKAARALDLEISVVTTAGSEDSLDQLDDPSPNRKLDVALVQGGLDFAKRENVRQVAAFNVEPLHLLVRPELKAPLETSLKNLRNKKVNLSAPKSGTNELARDVLAFAGLKNADKDFQVSTLSYQEIMKIEEPEFLPDAIFLVSSPPAPVAQHLISKWSYKLVELPFAEAFALRATRGLGGSGPIDHTRVYPTTIPPYSYGIDPATPERELTTFGTRLLMVAHKDVDPSVIDRLLTMTFDGKFAYLPHPPLDMKLLRLNPELELHAGTAEYLKRKEPLPAGDVIDFLEKTTSLAGAIIGAAFFLSHWFRQSVKRSRDLGFESYIKKVTEVERKVLEVELSANMDLKSLLGLQSTLAEIKNEALEKFTEGEIDGEELMSGFLAHVNDARNYLARLILHERENLERRAEETRTTPEKLWHEEIDEV